MKKLLLLLLISTLSFAEIKTFTKSIRQSISGVQTADDARLSAIKKLEADISREAGEYIQTHTVLKNSEIAKDEVLAISASILKTEVIKDKPYQENGASGLEITIRSTLDTSTIDKQISKILNSKENKEKIKELQRREAELLAMIERLERENKKAKTEAEKKAIKDEYKAAHRKDEALKYFDLGYEASIASEYNLALDYFSKSIELDPEYAVAYNNRGFVYGNLGNYTQAIKDYTKVIELDPKNASIYTDRGSIYADIGNYSQAIKDYDKAIELDPKNSIAYFNKGITYSEIEDYAQAISNYDEAININQKDADTYYNRGNAYEKLNNHTRAVKDYTKAIELDPKYKSAYNNRGVAYAILGNYTQASKDARTACQLGDCELLEALKELGFYIP